MKTFVRELLGDFKAAAVIGDPDSMAAVMDRVRNADEDDLPASALLPLGEALRGVPGEVLAPWLEDDDPGVRGIAAAAIGRLAHTPAAVPGDVLHFIAGDPVDDVRIAFADALGDGPDLAGTVRRFLDDGSLTVRRTALLLAARSPGLAMRNLEALAELDREPDHGLREDLVEALNRIAETGHAGPVLALLERWTDREEPNVWVITRVVSASWAQEHSQRCLEILKALGARVGENRSIARALERHM